MKRLVQFIFIFAGIMILSAVLSPTIYDILPQFKFERIFNRLVMIQTLIAAVLIVRIRRETLTKLGLVWSPQSVPFFSTAFGASFVVLGFLCLFYIGTGYAKLAFAAPSLVDWSQRIFMALASGMLIGIIEEFFFRGFVYQGLKDEWNFTSKTSVLVTSVFYSLIHFVATKKPFIGEDPSIRDGLRLMAAPFMSLLQLQSIWPEVVGLFIFGIVLNTLVIRTKSLYPAIGLHAGCVFFIKLDGAWIDFQNNYSIWLSSSKLYDGLLGWTVLLALGGVLLYIIPRVSKRIAAV